MNKAEQIVRERLARIKARSPSELADMIGMPRSTMAYKMKHPDHLNRRELRLIVRKTCMTPDELFELVTSER